MYWMPKQMKCFKLAAHFAFLSWVCCLNFPKAFWDLPLFMSEGKTSKTNVETFTYYTHTERTVSWLWFCVIYEHQLVILNSLGVITSFESLPRVIQNDSHKAGYWQKLKSKYREKNTRRGTDTLTSICANWSLKIFNPQRDSNYRQWEISRPDASVDRGLHEKDHLHMYNWNWEKSVFDVCGLSSRVYIHLKLMSATCGCSNACKWLWIKM